MFSHLFILMRAFLILSFLLRKFYSLYNTTASYFEKNNFFISIYFVIWNVHPPNCGAVQNWNTSIWIILKSRYIYNYHLLRKVNVYLSSLFPHHSCLRNNGSSHSNAFDAAFISTPPYSKEAVFTPACAPTVLHNPVLFASVAVNSVTHSQDGVIGD